MYLENESFTYMELSKKYMSFEQIEETYEFMSFLVTKPSATVTGVVSASLCFCACARLVRRVRGVLDVRA